MHGRELVRYRCHVGHGYTPEGLAFEQMDKVEGAMWSAVRALEEAAELRRRLGDRARAKRLPVIAAGYHAQVADLEQRAALIRTALTTDVGVEAVRASRRSAGRRRRGVRRRASGKG
jgi:two-component system chemotaxis response regulator CheB